MGKAKSYFYSRRGLTLVEFLVYIAIFAIFSAGIYSAINKVSIGQKKASLSSAVQNSQNLAMQNFAKTDKLKTSLALALGASRMAELEKCFNSLGTNCDSAFGTLQLPLTLDSSDPLSSDVSGSFAKDLSKCPDPNNCNKSFQQQVLASIICPNDVSCSEVKLNIAAQTSTNPDLALAPRNIELNVPAINFMNSGLKGLCSSNQGYINSVNIGNNTLECAPANTSLTPTTLVKTCSTPSFVDGKILAGLPDSNISNDSNNCQSTTVNDWTIALGFPSNGNSLPSVQKLIPLTPPRVSTQTLEGDIILILDDSKSLTRARAEVARGIRNIVDKLKNKQGTLNITGYTTDTFAPLKISNPLIKIIPEAGVKETTTTSGSGVNRLDITTFSLNDPFINMNIDKNDTHAGETIESSILNFPYAEGEEQESAACTLMKYMAENQSTQLQRKKMFLMFSDELDAFDFGVPFIAAQKNYHHCMSTKMQTYAERSFYRVNRFYRKHLDDFLAHEDEKFTSVRPPEANLKEISYYGVVASVAVKYKKWSGDEVKESFFNYGLAPQISPKDYNIDVSDLTYEGASIPCPANLKADLSRYFNNYIVSTRNAEPYYQTMATETEKNTVEYGDCFITKRRIFIANKLLNNFSNADSFYSYRPDILSEFDVPEVDLGQELPSKIFFNHNMYPFISTYELKNNYYSSTTVPTVRSSAELLNYVLQSHTSIAYFDRFGYRLASDLSTAPTNEPYEEWKQILPHSVLPTSAAEILSEIHNFPTPTKPQGSLLGKNVPGLIADTLEKTYGDKFAFVGFVHKTDSYTSCNDLPSKRNNLFLDLAAELPKGNASITDFCEFDKYDDAFDKIEDFLSTSDVDYSYEISLDDDSIATIKLFLQTNDISELPVQVSLLLNADSSTPPDIIQLARDTDFSFEIKNINSSQPKFFIHFSKNTQITNYLSHFKHIRVNIGQ